MSLLLIEKIGGLAGFGGAGAHIRSQGQVDMNSLPVDEQRAVEELFKSKGKAKDSQVRDGFRYRISRTLPDRTETIEAGEEAITKSLIQCVRDELV